VKSQQKKGYFVKNDEAVLGLPMRLTVSLVIGTVALLAILSYIMNPCVFPQKMVVSVTPMVVVLSGNESENLTFLVNITDSKGYPLRDASVLINGLGGAGSGFSNDNGAALIHLQVQMETGRHEGYLSVRVSSPCHESFEFQDMLKIVYSSI
jgi:hypothetical protein